MNLVSSLIVRMAFVVLTLTTIPAVADQVAGLFQHVSDTLSHAVEPR